MEESKTLLVMANPRAGAGHALKLAEQLRTALGEAEYAHDVAIDTARWGGNDCCELRDPKTLAGIVSVGGDGTFTGIVNGLAHQLGGHEHLTTVPIGLIPAGTDNGLGRSFGYQDITLLARQIAQAEAVPTDAVHVTMANGTNRMATLSLTWGAAAEYDRLVERAWRWAPRGLARGVAPLLVVLAGRRFQGRLTLDPGSATNREIDLTTMGLFAVNAPWIASDVNIAPNKTMADGSIQVVTIAAGSRRSLYAAYSRFAEGNHVDLSNVESHRCRELTLTPTGKRRGHFSIDGFVTPATEARLTILPHALRVWRVAD